MIATGDEGDYFFLGDPDKYDTGDHAVYETRCQQQSLPGVVVTCLESKFSVTMDFYNTERKVESSWLTGKEPGVEFTRSREKYPDLIFSANFIEVVVYDEDDARSIARDWAAAAQNGSRKPSEFAALLPKQRKERKEETNKVSITAFIKWLRETKGEPGDLWSPAPKASGLWVYGSTVAKFNEETGSSLSFMGLCSGLGRKPQVKDGKKRVLVLDTEVVPS